MAPHSVSLVDASARGLISGSAIGGSGRIRHVRDPRGMQDSGHSTGPGRDLRWDQVAGYAVARAVGMALS